jgi:FMN phosphatase YigB (HAD superfamily)
MKPKTIFCDIDGTLLKHQNRGCSFQGTNPPPLLDGVMDKINEWDRLGYNIILTTGRKESQRKITEEHLTQLGIIYDHLIMGLGGGDRIVINDRKPDSDRDTAYAINIDRNEGMINVKI